MRNIERVYNRNIRKECQKYEVLLEKCLKESWNDDFICEPHLKLFEECISNFDNKFRSKFNLKK
jgi:hypothetical protein